MAKYNYDKSILKGLGVGPFLKETKVRAAKIEEAEAVMPKSIFNPNIIAAKLHPHYQVGKIVKIIEEKDAKTFIMAPAEECGCKEFAYFRAGQYISVELEFGGAYMCKPYTISSSPKDALGQDNNTYSFTIKRNVDGYGSEYILNNWAVGTTVVMSGPLGNFYHDNIRDSKNMVGIAGGSGITPFLSMARAIADGIEDFNLTIFYGSRTKDAILLKDELEDAAARSGGKVKVIYVISDEEAPGMEHGFITAELVEKYISGDASYFICGPKALYVFIDKQNERLGLSRRRLRHEVHGEYGSPIRDEEYPQDKAGQTFKVKVWIRGESQEVTCKSEQTLLSAMEGAGIHVPSDCRSGECGWCHSRLISGETYIPETTDKRRAGDKKFGWVHPCSTYPLSDIEIEVFPLR